MIVVDLLERLALICIESFVDLLERLALICMELFVVVDYFHLEKLNFEFVIQFYFVVLFGLMILIVLIF